MNLTTELLHDTALFVNDYYRTNFLSDFIFHNYNRTLRIVQNCDTIGVELKLNTEDQKTLQVAAWFLETGYSKSTENYQSVSIINAITFLKEKDVDESIMNTVEELILSTRNPQQPVTLMAQIICDASMYHLAEKDLLQILENEKSETQIINQKDYSNLDWLNQSINKINNHFYFTTAARELFEKKKKKQKAIIQKQIDFLQQNTETIPAQSITTITTNPQLEKIKLERGVETFFRITEKRHMELATMAHDKASLLISINSIVISIVLSVLITKLEDNKYLLLPTLFLVITCAATIVLAIISTKPRIIKAGAKTDLSEKDEVNILFFGDASKLSLREYRKVMKKTYENKNELYDSISRDIYYQGIILVWKFKYIGIAYNVFMYGFLITITAFMIAFLKHNY